MESKIFWSSIEFGYDKDSPDFEKLIGGFVYVFVKSFDVIEALEKIQKAFSERNLIPIEVEYISPYNPELEWENEEDHKNYLELSDFAFRTGLVVFDDFYSYETIEEKQKNNT